MQITVAQIRALAEATKDWPEQSSGEINPRVKGGTDNGELCFSHGPFQRQVILSKTGRQLVE